MIEIGYKPLDHFFAKNLDDPAQESRREGWTDAAIMLCKLNKSL